MFQYNGLRVKRRMNSWISGLTFGCQFNVSENHYFKRRLLNSPFAVMQGEFLPSIQFAISGLGNARLLFRFLALQSYDLPEELLTNEVCYHVYLRRKIRSGREDPLLATDRWWVFAGFDYPSRDRLSGRWGRLFDRHLDDLFVLGNPLGLEDEWTDDQFSSVERLNEIINVNERVVIIPLAPKKVRKNECKLSYLFTGFSSRDDAISVGLRILDNDQRYNGFTLLSSTDLRCRYLHNIPFDDPSYEEILGQYFILLEENMNT